ncbi:SlyX protein [Paracoccus limosus]|uniref:SlyX protein n=1 Tax=Paracoccus limosus TaxID=913252 RepID=A0A844H8Q7_9RHOB|nr:SlyX family protein [Paracoccus limosus]MTH36244.1 SlyX protein [Paracoccus limosus]
MDKNEQTLRLEEAVAHLSRVVEDLSEVVARQERDIARLSRRVGLLMEREAEREAEGGTIPLADQRPPHW